MTHQRTGAPADGPPHPMTFFLTARQRARIVRALRRIHPDRSRALLIALGLEGRR